MQTSFFHKLSSALWVGIVLLMVLLAVYVSVGRLVAGNIGQYQAAILSELNYRAPFTVAADTVTGEWHSFTPVIVMSGLHLSVPESDAPPLELAEGRLAIDVFNSLRTRSLQLSRLSLTGLALNGELTGDGGFRLTGFGSGEGEVGDWVRELVLNLETVALRENSLRLKLPGGELRDFDLGLLLAREGSQRRVQASLLSTRGTEILILGEGVGDPFRPDNFSGDLYLNVRSDDLGAVRDVLGEMDPGYWPHGQLDLDLWLGWDKGEPEVESRLQARELRIVSRDGAVEVPLDAVALDARVAKRRDRWTIYGSDLSVTRDDREVVLPRLQFDLWEGAQRLRAADLDLESLHKFVSALGVLPENLEGVLDALAPRGGVSALQFAIGDMSSPGQDWSLETRFEDVEVDSYRGAPGGTAASGYARLSPGGGTVVLDSRGAALAFPKIYREPLAFDALYGSLDLGWDDRRFWISSGLLTAEGQEGVARAFFGLDVPLQPRPEGVEMDLLVGLADSSAEYRDKYLPFTLNEGLLDWLAGSIEGGQLAAGGFAWRGSLARDLGERRTVQLAFNVEDADLEYHPDWPAARAEEAVVFVDDNAVSAWSDRAALYATAVTGLSVETWINRGRKLELAVAAQLAGPAEDGFRVLNESPLSGIVGNAFTDWQAEGQLEADLLLGLRLDSSGALPQVDVQTRWRDVDLLIAPGSLPVQAVNGEFSYSSEQGFAASDITARLWDESVSGELLQTHEGDGYAPGTSSLRVAFASQADMQDVYDWLRLKPLGLASGMADVDVAFELSPGKAPLLSVESDLVGISLDLPEPWDKRPGEQVPFRLAMPLAPDSPPLRISLGDQLFLDLDINGGEFLGGALGVSAPPLPVQPGTFRVSGHASLVQGDQCIEFVSRHVLSPAAPDAAQQVDAGLPADALRVTVEGLTADEVQMSGWIVDDVQLDLAFEPAHWRLGLNSRWFGGELVLAQRGGESSLHLTHLDLDHLPARRPQPPEVDPGPGQGNLDIPAMDVRIDALQQSGRHFGELAFGLHSEFGVLTADTVTGELAGLRFDEASPGSLVWHQGVGGRTELRASLAFGDLGATLEHFGYERIVKTESGTFELDVDWPAAPQAFALIDARGRLSVDLGSGSFPEAPGGAAGALRVVSILNLADIVRRLSMSHMFESGIPFESVRGDLLLANGILEVPALEVTGSSSFQFSAVSDIEQQSIEGELVATLPVARNLPWIAALAANLPVAAGVYVASKVFDKQFNRLSSAVYRIDGTWDEPEVKFDRIFDDASQVAEEGGADG